MGDVPLHAWCRGSGCWLSGFVDARKYRLFSVLSRTVPNMGPCTYCRLIDQSNSQNCGLMQCVHSAWDAKFSLFEVLIDVNLIVTSFMILNPTSFVRVQTVDRWAYIRSILKTKPFHRSQNMSPSRQRFRICKGLHNWFRGSIC